MDALSLEELARLRAHFARLSGDPALRAELERRHAEPQRFYHTARHVLELLDLLSPLGAKLEDREATLWAVWFHDAVYDPRASDNEEKSAQLALERLTFLDTPGLEHVSGLILATKTHHADSSDAQLLLDADLAVLGSPRARYLEYAHAIHREYAFVPLGAYRAARADVLRRFLERERIYATPEFASLEEQARDNLACEIGALEEEEINDG